MTVRLPDPPKTLDPELTSYLRQLIVIIENELRNLSLPAGLGWNPTNVPTTSLDTYRQFDASAASTADVRGALARLIYELTQSGKLNNG